MHDSFSEDYHIRKVLRSMKSSVRGVPDQGVLSSLNYSEVDLYRYRQDPNQPHKSMTPAAITMQKCDEFYVEIRQSQEKLNQKRKDHENALSERSESQAQQIRSNKKKDPEDTQEIFYQNQNSVSDAASVARTIKAFKNQSIYHERVKHQEERIEDPNKDLSRAVSAVGNIQYAHTVDNDTETPKDVVHGVFFQEAIAVYGQREESKQDQKTRTQMMSQIQRKPETKPSENLLGETNIQPRGNLPQELLEQSPLTEQAQRQLLGKVSEKDQRQSETSFSQVKLEQQSKIGKQVELCTFEDGLQGKKYQQKDQKMSFYQRGEIEIIVPLQDKVEVDKPQSHSISERDSKHPTLERVKKIVEPQKEPIVPQDSTALLSERDSKHTKQKRQASAQSQSQTSAILPPQILKSAVVQPDFSRLIQKAETEVQDSKEQSKLDSNRSVKSSNIPSSQAKGRHSQAKQEINQEKSEQAQSRTASQYESQSNKPNITVDSKKASQKSSQVQFLIVDQNPSIDHLPIRATSEVANTQNASLAGGTQTNRQSFLDFVPTPISHEYAQFVDKSIQMSQSHIKREKISKSKVSIGVQMSSQNILCSNKGQIPSVQSSACKPESQEMLFQSVYQKTSHHITEPESSRLQVQENQKEKILRLNSETVAIDAKVTSRPRKILLNSDTSKNMALFEHLKPKTEITEYSTKAEDALQFWFFDRTILPPKPNFMAQRANSAFGHSKQISTHFQQRTTSPIARAATVIKERPLYQKTKNERPPFDTSFQQVVIQRDRSPFDTAIKQPSIQIPLNSLRSAQKQLQKQEEPRMAKRQMIQQNLRRNYNSSTVCELNQKLAQIRLNTVAKNQPQFVMYQHDLGGLVKLYKKV